MLTIFNGSDGYPISNDDYYIRELASGYDEAIFNVSIRDPIYQYVKEEAIVRDRDQNVYLVKQIDAGDTSAKVVAQIDLDDWKSTIYMDYSNNSATVADTVSQILPTGWSLIDYSMVTKRRTIPTSDTNSSYNVTALEVLEDCADVYGVRFRFNTADNIIYIINPDNYTSKGAFVTRDLNLKTLNYKGKSDSFVTRLYAEGADGLTFADINGGKAYVENTNYANKVISAFWKDERYTDAQSLLEDAQAKIDEMGYPTQSYSCDVLDLASTNPDMYGFEDFSLFEVVTLIDDAKGVRTDYQVVERWNYPYYPVQNKVTLSTSTPNIQSAIATVVNSINSSTSPYQQRLQSAIANATALITGNHGGYLVLYDSNGDGTPDELLIMDTDSIETATKVWRWNSSGLGYSSTGYNGSFDIGITMDGAIVADFITAGTLNGNIIEAGTINANALSVSAIQEFDLVHNYLPYDFMSNISRWKPNLNYGTRYYSTITVGGEVKDCIVLDATTQTFAYIAISCLTDVVQSPTFHVSFKYQYESTNIVQHGTVLLFVGYNADTGQTNSKTIYEMTVGDTIVGGQEYEVDLDYTVPFNCDPYQSLSTSKPHFDFWVEPFQKMYIYDLEIYGTSENYKDCSLTYTVDGLNSTVRAGSVISSINQSAESVSIAANKINLTGDLSLRGDFHSYNSNDSTTYVFMDDGNLQFWQTGDVVFAIAADYNGHSGIIFGNPADYMTNAYTIVQQNFVKTNNLLGYYDGTVGTGGFGSDDTLVSEGTAKFYGGIIVDDSVLQSALGTGVVNVFNNSTKFVGNVYNSSGSTVFVSDKRKKRSIKDLVIEKARSFIMSLKPKKFKFTKDISKSDRYHHGFIAQEVKEAMNEDWGVYVEDKENNFIGLRYDELIADMVSVIQDHEKRIAELERRINDLTSNQP